MNPATPEPLAAASFSCTPACGYAEPLAGDYADWLWCTRPGASVRVRRLGADCPWTAPAGIGDEFTGRPTAS